MSTFEQEKVQEILGWLEEVVEEGVLPGVFVPHFRDLLNDLPKETGHDQDSPEKQTANESLMRIRSKMRANERTGADVDAETLQEIRDALGVINRDQPAAKDKKSGKLPILGPHDLHAWKLHLATEWTQTRIAEELNKEYGTSYSQGQLSKMIDRAKRNAVASGLSEHIPDSAEPARKINPNWLALGKRTDRLTSRQRAKGR